MKVKKVSPLWPEVNALIEQLNQHNLKYYPPDECHLDPPDVLAQENCSMFGVYDDLEILGIGAIKFFADYAEVKRMFVSPQARGRGVAQLILDQLISEAGQKGLNSLCLETGEKFEAAMSFYKKNGFKVCEPFGPYRYQKHCTCMQRNIHMT